MDRRREGEDPDTDDTPHDAAAEPPDDGGAPSDLRWPDGEPRSRGGAAWA